MDEVARFIDVWEQESRKTESLLGTLPRDQYDFRPDAGGRSLGELAWHLAEGDAYMTFGIERGAFDMAGEKPSGRSRWTRSRRGSRASIATRSSVCAS